MRLQSGILPSRDNPINRYLPAILGLLVFVCTIAFAAGMFLYGTGEKWRVSLSETFTVEVPAGAAQPRNIETIVSLLKQNPKIISARHISEIEVAKILEPWLGPGFSVVGLPIPALVDVTVASRENIDFKALSSQLEKIAEGVVVDDHSAWRSRLGNFVDIIEAIYFGVMAVMLICTISAVILATRTGLEIHADIVELLHLIGARDSFIAWRFQFHTLLLSAPSVIGGFLIGTGTVYLIQVYGGKLDGELFVDLTLNPAQWFSLALLPFIVLLIISITVGTTVRRRLRRMM